jgi:DNA repair protein SbcC/Rad50
VRPLNLVIEGFTAFRERQEIDFEGLGLFVITGPTGAGKSSILDAMAFALYGQAPRLGGKRGTSDLVSLGKVQARVQFEFSIAGKGQFRVARRLNRNGRQEATLERLEGVEWAPAYEHGGLRECDRVLGELLGLDFDAFCKAVLLPQGEFHRFLKGEAKDRRQVLVSLLGVSYFQSMGEKARERARHLSAGVARTEEILSEQYAEATTDRITEVKTNLRDADSRLTQLAAAVKAAADNAHEGNEHSDKCETAKTLVGELEDLEDTLTEELPAVADTESKLATAKQALEQATGAFQQRKEASTAADKAAKQLQEENGTLEQILDAATAAETLQETAPKKTECESKVATSEAALKAANESLRAADKAQTAAEEEREAAKRADEQGEKDARTAEQLESELQRLLAEAQQEAAELAKASSACKERHQATEQARASAYQARERHEELLSALEQHRRLHVIAELADGVHVGDPCPVCGVAVAKPLEVADEEAQALQAAHDGEETARGAARTADRDLSDADAALKSAELLQAQTTKHLTRALAGREDVKALQADAKRAKADNKTAVAAAGAARAALTKAEQASRDARDLTTKCRGGVEAHKTALASAKEALTDTKKRRDRAAATLTVLFADKVPANAAKLIDQRRTDLNAAQKTAEKARGDLDAATTARDAARGDAETAEQALRSHEQTLILLHARAETAEKGSRELLGPAIKLDSVPPKSAGANAPAARALASWSRKCATKVASARDREMKAADKAFDAIILLAAKHDVEATDAQQALNSLNTAERDARDAKARAETGVQEATKRLAERERMEAKIRDENEQIAVLTELGHELRSDRFGEYIIEETLMVLAKYASDELMRISDDRYSLVPVDGAFDVIDHANADEQRSVKTLSGGETFLASLSLALALSRHVGSLATEGLGTKLEAVFIDEGFGTLDPATLEDVIDALERLRADDLIVGVISHLPELAQRIQAGLEVRKEEGRSTVLVTTG